ncbi:MAG TPA: helix-turn-helix transcriptional regulator [Dehalococcoidia bacterium]|nr:helix-turn-helix transcriptional regulator [Dehalococcoidia bacterium]
MARTKEPADKAPRLHGEMLSTSLLAFLKNWNAYGYELSQKLKESGLPQFDNGTVYRTLRQLEGAGLVSSFWDTSESGPARRMYSLTKAGDIFLSGWIDALQNYQNVLRSALDGLTPPGPAAPAAKPSRRRSRA